LAFSKHETPASLVKLFRLPEEDARLRLEVLIFKITGWDVLRPPRQAGPP
jgi:hypothetical protein